MKTNYIHDLFESFEHLFPDEIGQGEFLGMGDSRQYLRHHDYIGILGTQPRQEVLNKVCLLIDQFPDAFMKASTDLSPEGWRLLFYAGSYSLENLATPRFAADISLRKSCVLTEFDVFIDKGLIGSDEDDPEVVAEKTDLSLRYLGSNPCKAVFATLAAAQSMAFSPEELLECQWWKPGWIKDKSARLKARN